MSYKIPLAAAALAFATFAAPTLSSAAALSGAPQSTVAIGDRASVTQQVQWYPRWRERRGWGGGRCRAWRHECADRWGWGGPRFRRCLWRHGC